MTDENHVLVLGPHGRHIEVHKRTQAALPEAFPLVPEKPKQATRKKPTRKSRPAPDAAPSAAQSADHEDPSGTTVPETDTVDEEGATQ